MHLPIFPEITISNTELDILATHLGNPTVKKYFHKLAYDIATQLAIHGEPAEGESAEVFLRRQSNLRGQLEVLNTLLIIEDPAIPQKQSRSN